MTEKEFDWDGEAYLRIPVTVLKKTNLKPNEKIIYCMINSFTDGTFRASNDFIAEYVGISKRSVQRAVKQLVHLRIIRREEVYEGGLQIGRILTIVRRG